MSSQGLVDDERSISNLHRAAAILASAEFLLVHCGAGMSADSGLSTYQNPKDNYLDSLGLSYEAICDPKWVENPQEAFESWQIQITDPRIELQMKQLADQPAEIADEDDEKIDVILEFSRAELGSLLAVRLYWGYWLQFAQRCTNANLHHGYDVLSRWKQRFGSRSFAVTTNVDGLLRKSWPDAMWEIHGCVHDWQCSQLPNVDASSVCPFIDVEGNPSGSSEPAEQSKWTQSEAVEVENGLVKLRSPNQISSWHDLLPKQLWHKEQCECGTLRALMRPRVMGFSDGRFADDHRQRNECERWVDQMMQSSRVVIVEIGCGKAVPTLRNRSEAVFRALNRNARMEWRCALLRINVSCDDCRCDWLPYNTEQGPKQVCQRIKLEFRHILIQRQTEYSASNGPVAVWHCTRYANQTRCRCSG